MSTEPRRPGRRDQVSTNVTLIPSSRFIHTRRQTRPRRLMVASPLAAIVRGLAGMVPVDATTGADHEAVQVAPADAAISVLPMIRSPTSSPGAPAKTRPPDPIPPVAKHSPPGQSLLGDDGCRIMPGGCRLSIHCGLPQSRQQQVDCAGRQRGSMPG
jgi:hypothetical protein